MLDRVRDFLSRREEPAGKLDIHSLIGLALRFRAHLESVKAGLKPDGWGWYPYDSFTNFYPIRKLLQGEHRYLLELAHGLPVLDVGCADGALAFFLESQGAAVHAVDYPATNFIGMRGVRALHAALGSHVEIFEMDLDGRFALPPARYGLAFFLGTLYHLKNPFYALEALARQARYGLLSTRIARLTPDGQVNFREHPMAYLLDAGEANGDSTNYWIFSEWGLRRILDRAGWDVLALTTTGDTRRSNPSGTDHDERAFCLLGSREFASPPGS
jgi:SAM-dependent methyltransferase